MKLERVTLTIVELAENDRDNLQVILNDRTGVIVRKNKVNNNSARYLFPGEEVVLESKGSIRKGAEFIALYRPGETNPFYVHS